MLGRTRWRDIGRPEAALIGAQYVGWDEDKYANHPYHVVNTEAAPWLFNGLGAVDGAALGSARYGIEFDMTGPFSPPGTTSSPSFPTSSGLANSQMTIYRVGRSTVFDAGALNFGASAHSPPSRLSTTSGAASAERHDS
jgi:hypothetical protein